MNIKETYIVRFDLKKSDGYWRMNVEEEVVVLSSGKEIKNNHLKASEVIEKKYPGGCKVTRVTYS